MFFVKYYSSGLNKEEEIDGACSMNGGDNKCMQNAVKKPIGKNAIWIPMARLDWVGIGYVRFKDKHEKVS